MRERYILECIRDMADMEFEKTKDEWWLRLAIAVEKKERNKNEQKI